MSFFSLLSDSGRWSYLRCFTVRNHPGGRQRADPERHGLFFWSALLICDVRVTGESLLPFAQNASGFTQHIEAGKEWEIKLYQNLWVSLTVITAWEVRLDSQREDETFHIIKSDRWWIGRLDFHTLCVQNTHTICTLGYACSKWPNRCNGVDLALSLMSLALLKLVNLEIRKALHALSAVKTS